MKTATIPSLRVTPELRHQAEDALQEGESLSAFVETALREHIERRRTRQHFIARGLAAREAASTSGQYASKEDVMDSLKSMLESSRQAR